MKHFFSIHRSLATITLLALISASSFCLAADSRGLTRIKAPASDSLNKGTYRALIIGNNDYKDPKKQWLPLKTAISDASALAKLLEKDYGFKDTILLKNATRKTILRAINDLTKKTQANDSVLVYYAGHGWRNEQTKEAFWIPVDAEGQDDSGYISNVRIKEKLGIIANTAAHTLLISDSCFSGSLLDSRGRNFKVKDDSSLSYFQKVAERKSVQILAAGGKEYVDDNYRGSSHSPFTYFLINELKLNNERFITLGNLALNIEELVAKNAQQTPQSGAFRQAGDEGGQFIFAKINVIVNTDKIVSNPNPNLANQQNELSDWNKINTNNIAQVHAFIDRHPNGSISSLARLKLKELQQRVDDLFSLAEVDISNQRYALPPGRNAMERYLAVLSIDESNQMAKTSLENLFDSTSSKVKANIDARDYEAANNLLKHVERIQPSNKNHANTLRHLRDEIVAIQNVDSTSKIAPNPSYDQYNAASSETQDKPSKPQEAKPSANDRYIPSFSF